jgi:hypothetical protein
MKLNEVRSISVICLLFIIGKINACFVQFYRTVMFVFEILCSCVSEYVNPTKQRHSSDNPCHDVGQVSVYDTDIYDYIESCHFFKLSRVSCRV